MSARRNAGARRERHAVTGGPLATLMAAPGGEVFFDGDYGYAADGSNKLSALVSRIDSYTLAQASGPLQPTWGVTSPTGKRGITFAAANSTVLVDPATTLAGLLDGVDSYSSLVVCKPVNSVNTRVIWSAGSSTTTSMVREAIAGTTHLDRRSRRNNAAGTTNNDGSAVTAAIHCITTTFDGSAYNSWIDGTASLAAAANTRSAVCDIFSIGASFESGSALNYFDGDIWCVLIALGVWTTAQRTQLQAAAKAYWGTP